MSRVKQCCKRLVVKANSITGYSFSYQCPVSKNDRKREGRTLVISDGRNTMSVDGHGLRVLKRVLKDCGEYGRRVNHKRAKVVLMGPKG